MKGKRKEGRRKLYVVKKSKRERYELSSRKFAREREKKNFFSLIEFRIPEASLKGSDSTTRDMILQGESLHVKTQFYKASIICYLSPWYLY